MLPVLQPVQLGRELAACTILGTRDLQCGQVMKSALNFFSFCSLE